MSNATQTDIFWSIKSFLEKSVRNRQVCDFIDFCALALGEVIGEEISHHIRLLRTFVVQNIFCEYFRIAREAPDAGNPAWAYVLPCLRAVSEIYPSVWNSLVAENICGLEALVDDLISLMIAMHGMLDIISETRRGNGALSVTVSARIYDFAIFAEHVEFYLRDGIHVGGKFLRRTHLIIQEPSS